MPKTPAVPGTIRRYRVNRFVNRGESVDFEQSVLQSAIVQAMMNVYAEIATGSTIQMQVRHWREDDRPAHPRGRVQLVVELALLDVSNTTTSMFTDESEL